MSLVTGWAEANGRHLAATLGAIRQRLLRLTGVSPEDPGAEGGQRPPADPPPVADFREVLGLPLPAGPGSDGEGLDLPPPALTALAAEFALTPFEAELLLLVAGPDLDPAFASLCAELQGGQRRPTFALARAALPGAHWSALSPSHPLRLWRLLETDPGAGSLVGPLRLPERVLLHLVGVPAAEPRLVGRIEAVAHASELGPGARRAAEHLLAHWRQAGDASSYPLAEIRAGSPEESTAIAAAACDELGLTLHRLAAHTLPTAPEELEALRRLWEREATLVRGALLVDARDLPAEDRARGASLVAFLEQTWGPLLVAGTPPRRPRRPAIVVDVPRTSAGEQRQLWQLALGERAANLGESIEALVSHFHLAPEGIRSVCQQVLVDGGGDREELGRKLWDACRVEVRPALPGLARRIESAAGWDDLVLPEEPRSLLAHIVTHVRHRRQVLEEWGFGASGSRGLATTALFAGPSGTGKTLAAEVLARELRLDLYQIDLSNVVSKYIGETEKNLARLFDAAEGGSAVLLFDEADALFGKRSEVKDSHDRYANLEVSYLLQRIEAYTGLAILTTNLKGNLDPAFLRRIRFLVRFPFPDASQRLAIWRRVLPPAMPRGPLDLGTLAQLNITGANIRNIALSAAFSAAAAGRPLSMGDLLAAARMEHAKLEKTMPDLGQGPL